MVWPLLLLRNRQVRSGHLTLVGRWVWPLFPLFGQVRATLPLPSPPPPPPLGSGGGCDAGGGFFLACNDFCEEVRRITPRLISLFSVD